jgi:hypothetical protein
MEFVLRVVRIVFIDMWILRGQGVGIIL